MQVGVALSKTGETKGSVSVHVLFEVTLVYLCFRIN